MKLKNLFLIAGLLSTAAYLLRADKQEEDDFSYPWALTDYVPEGVTWH